MARSLAVASALAAALLARAAAAEDKDAKTAPRDVGGVEEPAHYPDDAARAVGNWLLFVPRNVVDYTFRGTELAASLVADQQLVPRYREVFGRPGEDLFIFPTLFAETGAPASVGLRMIFDSRHVATSQRIGFGGPHQVAVESRVVIKGEAGRLPYIVSLEALYQLADKNQYWGIGIHPDTDCRNRPDGARGDCPSRPDARYDAFSALPPPYSYGFYTERKVRAIASLGLRLGRDIEFFLSTSLYRRQLRPQQCLSDDCGGGTDGQSIEHVFDATKLPGFGAGPRYGNDNPWISYSEVAARFDTRQVRTRPWPGMLLEGYLGGAHDVGGEPVAFMRLGMRAAGYIPIYRRSNILSPRIVLDRVQPLGDTVVPFTELARQPDFRGYDTRRDYLSMVASIDYSWLLVPAMGMRVFFDAATVAPALTQLKLEQLKYMRLAGGLAIDLFAGKSTLASIGLSGSGDGVRFLATIGVPSSYGDRQHRD